MQARSHGGHSGENSPQIFFVAPQILRPKNIILKTYKNKDIAL